MGIKTQIPGPGKLNDLPFSANSIKKLSRNIKKAEIFLTKKSEKRNS